MRFRKLALAVSLAGALGCEMASALGLGEIKLNSTLNQPLDAEIKLLRLRELGEGEILVNVASRDDFQRAGVDRVFFLNDLKFEIVLENPSGPIIKVTTRKVVREPFLNFLLETQWPNGRILREYTLLMDLPVFGDESVRAVTRATKSAPAPQQPAVVSKVREPTPVAEPAAPVADVPEADDKPLADSPRSRPSSAPAKRIEGGVFGPVGATDTLWEIALKARPDRSYSVQQTMLAIQRLNPEAFINGNINLLRKGQVLRLPKASQISELNGRQAVNEVAFQNDQWSGDADGDLSGAQLDGSGRSASSPASASSKQGRLKLASGAEAENVDAGRGAGEVGGDTEALQNELAITLDELDKTRRDNGELKSRIDELEMQIQTMERLVDVSSQELRALQLAGQSSAEAEADVIPAPVVADTAVSEDVNSIDPAPEAKAVAQAPAAKVVDPSRVVLSSPKKEVSLLDTVFDNIALVAGGIVALLAGVALVLRRRKEDEGEDDELSSSMIDDEPLFVGDDTEVEGDLAVDEGDIAADSVDIEGSLESELEDFDLGELELDGFESEETDAVSTESQTGDAVGEADIYIAYGKYDQAEEMLLKALDANNESLDARMKLLEVYAETNDAAKFDAQYASVMATHDMAAQERAATLRKQLSGVGEYNSDVVHDVADENLALDDGLDFDLGDAGDSLGDEALELEDGLDLDLDLESSMDATDDAGGELSFDLDFDLDDETPSSGLELEGAEEASLLTLASDDDDEFSLDLELGDSHLQDEFSLESELQNTEESTAFDLPELDEVTSLDSEVETGSEESLGDSLDELSVLSDEMGAELEVENSVALDTESDSAFDLDFGLESDSELQGADTPLAADLDLESEDVVDLGASLEVMPTLDEGVEDDDNHFDLDLGDVDLASLDLEVDALSADLDMGDDDFAALVLDEPTESVGLDELSADLGGVDDLDSELELALNEPLELDLPEDELDLGAFETPEDTSELDDLELDVSELDVPELDDLELDAPELDASELETPELEAVDMEASELVVSELDDLELDVPELDAPELDVPELEVPELEVPELDAFELDAPELDLAESENAELSTADFELSEELSIEGVDAASEFELPDTSLELTADKSDDLPVEFAEFETTDPEAAVDDLMTGEEVAETIAEPEPEFDLAADLGLDEAEELPSTEEGMFDAALADLPEPEDALEDLPELTDEDAELDFLADTDEAATKLDLARAYIDMGDQEGAKDILDEVIQEGSEEQRSEADELLARMS